MNIFPKPGQTEPCLFCRVAVPLGISLATIISWTLHKSVLWAIVHGILSWVYVIYYVVTR